MAQPQDNKVDMREVMDDFDRFEDFFESRWKQLIYLCIAAVVTVGVVTWAISAHRASRTRAAAALGAAETPEAIREALAAHGRHPAAAYAQLRLVRLLFDAGKFDEALAEVQSLVAARPKAPEVLWQARLSEGYILETQDRLAEAAEAFATLGLEIEMAEFVRDEANVNAARIFLALDQPERARGCLQAVNTAKGYMDAGVFWAEQAKALLNRLPAAAQGA
jgi:tetratricopeptide (TPR) repeat protein